MSAIASHLTPGRLAVFLFHGVIPEEYPGVRNYNAKHLTAERFVEIIDELTIAGTPVSVPQAIRAVHGEIPLPDRAFAVTFDDGFENNLSVAAPILEERCVPATFYVTTAFVTGDAPSWADLLDEAVERTSAETLDLPEIGEQLPLSSPDERVAALDRMRGLAKGNPTVDPYAFAAAVRARLGVGPFRADRWLDRKLTWDAVRVLAGHELFTVGGHGHTHRILAFLDERELRDEISTAVSVLAREMDAPVEHYSYPEGTPSAHSDLVRDVLRKHGVTSSMTAEPGTNSVGDDPFLLRRITVA